MPRIPDDHLDAIVYLYPSRADAQAGERMGGTGFVVLVRFAPPFADMGHWYVVTNRHVALNAPVIRMNLKEGGTDAISLDANDWTFHPDGDDLAMWRVVHDAKPFRLRTIESDLIVSEEEYQRVGFGLGDECIMLGRFIGIVETDRLRPSARFGNLARTDAVPVKQSGLGIVQESLLVETRSISGFSGSPVFAYRASTMKANTEGGSTLPAAVSPLVSSPYGLIGIDWGHMPFHGRVYAEDRATLVDPPMWAAENSGLMMVVPAWKLLDMLDDDAEIDVRKQVEINHASTHAPPVASGGCLER